MSGKKKTTAGWKPQLLGLANTTAVELAGVLVTTLLVVRGVISEERLTPVLTAWALCGTLLGGLLAGKGRLGPGGALVNGAAFGGLLALAAFAYWEGVTAAGLPLLAAVLTGGVLAALILGKVGKRRGKRLVRFTKNAHFS